MMKRSGLSLVLGGIALPLLASLPVLAQQPTTPPDAPATQSDVSRPRNQLTPADRAAFLDARIAAVHAGLHLSADQEKLWPPLENAVRSGLTKLADLREKLRTAGRPADGLERMSRGAEASITRGEAMKGIADAARPLYATLTDEQKRRLPMLTRGGDGARGRDRDRMARPGMMNQGRMDRGMMRRGDRRDDERPMQGRRWSDRDGYRDRF